MRFLSVLLSLSIGLIGCAHSRPWSARTLAPCTRATGIPELERERSYLASLLALDGRRYAIVHTVTGREIEATYSTDYPASQPTTRWVLSVLDDARVVLDVPSTVDRVSEREMQWADRLAFSITQNQCRELDWLRWEAQNRGLIAVGAGLAAAAPPASAGADRPALTATPPAASRASQIAALRQERAKIRIAPPAAGAAVGVGFAVAGISMLSTGLVYIVGGCQEDSWDEEADCTLRDAGRIIAPIGAGVLAAGGIAMAVALPIMLRRLRHARELGRRMKALQTLQVGPQSTRGGVGIVLGGAF